MTDTTEVQGEVEGKTKHPLEHSWSLWFDNPQVRLITTVCI